MQHGEILTAWGVNAMGQNTPQVTLDYLMTPGESWSEGEAGYGSGQGFYLLTPPLDPNVCILYVHFTAKHMDAIDADPDYVILWREELPEETM